MHCAMRLSRFNVLGVLQRMILLGHTGFLGYSARAVNEYLYLKRYE